MITYNTTMKITKYDTPTVDATGGGELKITGKVFAKCRIRLLMADERVVSGREGVVASSRIYCPIGTSVDENDTITIGNNDYDVAVIENPHGMNLFLQIDVIRRF